MGEGKHLYKKNALSFLVITCFGWVGINPFYGCFLLLSEGRLSGWCAWMTEHMWQEHGLREKNVSRWIFFEIGR